MSEEKETIINGIDVSECEFLVKGIECKIHIDESEMCEGYDAILGYCPNITDCYYKQLKRLQQENKKLKEVANEAIIEHENLLINRNEFAERAEKLEQENKELKERLCETKQFLKDEHEESSKFCQQIEAFKLSENEAKEIIAELEHENKELKEKIKSEKYIKENVLQEATKYSMKCGEFRQTLEEIRKQYVNKAFFKCDKTEEECPCHNCIILGQLDRVQNIIKIIDEVLNEK